MAFDVYILESETTKRYYIGQTNNLERRIKDHQRGKDHATKNGGPWQIMHVETFDTRSEAMRREKQLKSYKSRAAIEKIIGTAG